MYQVAVAASEELREGDVVLQVNPYEEHGPGHGQEDEESEEQRAKGVAGVALVIFGVVWGVDVEKST
jgi:hypothetical protein